MNIYIENMSKDNIQSHKITSILLSILIMSKNSMKLCRDEAICVLAGF